MMKILIVWIDHIEHGTALCCPKTVLGRILLRFCAKCMEKRCFFGGEEIADTGGVCYHRSIRSNTPLYDRKE